MSGVIVVLVSVHADALAAVQPQSSQPSLISMFSEVPVRSRGVRLGVRGTKAISMTAMLLGVLLVGCTVDSTPRIVDPSVAVSGSAPEEYVARYGGSEAVYSEILAEADCTHLKASFDHSSALGEATEPSSDEARMLAGYTAAAGDRMRAIGCS